jgi:hypothetical protein
MNFIVVAGYRLKKWAFLEVPARFHCRARLAAA